MSSKSPLRLLFVLALVAAPLVPIGCGSGEPAPNTAGPATTAPGPNAGPSSGAAADAAAARKAN